MGVWEFIDEDFQDKYAGEADSKREWPENFVEELGVLEGAPENLRPYFDEEQYVRDMELNGDIGFVEFEGTVYAFWS